LSLVCRLSGLDDRKLETGDRWAEPSQAYALHRGWLSSGESGNWDQPITRELAAKLLVGALFPEDVKKTGNSALFTDQGQVSQAYLPYVRTAASLKLMGGYADGRFAPSGTMTRGAAAAVLHRARSLREKRGPAKGGSVQVPVLMYHDVSYLGRGYSKTPEVFRRQMEELKNAGFHTVTYAQLVDYVEKGTPLPAKPIVVSVDDGYMTNYQYIYPILQDLDMKIELSVIGDAIQYAEWGLNWEEVREMSQSGLVAIESHTKQLHTDNSAQGGRQCAMKLKSETWADYIQVLEGDLSASLTTIEAETGVRPVAFTYPLGKWNAMAEAVAGDLGCKVTLTTKDGVAKVTQGDRQSLRLMDRIGMDFLNGSVVAVLRQFGYKNL